jgi:ERCC4-type nuclease
MGEDFDYTFVDRKSYQDFCSTVTNGYRRFIKEIERCKSLESFLFVVVEAPFDGLENENKKNFKKFKLDYVFHQMREIQADYSDCCQFIFSGSRQDSIDLIPKILVLGKKLWRVDLQYFWNKKIKHNGLGSRQTKTKKRIQRYKPVTRGERGVFGGK